MCLEGVWVEYMQLWSQGLVTSEVCEFRVRGSGFRVQDLGFRVQDLGSVEVQECPGP